MCLIGETGFSGANLLASASHICYISNFSVGKETDVGGGHEKELWFQDLEFIYSSATLQLAKAYTKESVKYN